MDPAKTELTQEQTKHHFLFYLFKADKASNPMPQSNAAALLLRLKKLFITNSQRSS